MGTGVGDYNNDGYLDYYMTNIRFNHFMVSQGPGKPFVNKAKEKEALQSGNVVGTNIGNWWSGGKTNFSSAFQALKTTGRLMISSIPVKYSWAS